MKATSGETEELSAAFLHLYEDVKRRFKELGLRGDIQTLEKLQAMILVFLEKGRPIRPYELVDTLTYNPAFSGCKDARRMIFYILERLMKTGIIEKTTYKDTKSYYRLTEHREVQAGKMVGETITRLKDPKTREILNLWKRLFELRSIIKLWRINSLGHALVYELHSLQEKLAEFTRDRGEKRETLEDTITELIEIYTGYTNTGTIPAKEADLFYDLGNSIRGLTRIWTTGGTA